jgi:flavorubredoxin
MAFEPIMPTVQYPPLQVAEDTWLIRQMQLAVIGPLWVDLNSLVIKGAEPIIVDTGTPVNRRQWLQDVFSIVEPGDVRWIFLSHDDIDHSGNLREVAEACPNATLVNTWFFHERHACDFAFPKERCRWVNDGDSWRAGDRTLTAVLPPLFDSPVTRGLYDDRTGVYWAADSWAVPLPGPMDDVSELDPAAWQAGVEMFNTWNCPWCKMVDQAKYDQHVDRVQNLDIEVIASCHSPLIRRPQIDQAFSIIRGVPQAVVPPLPGHADLEALKRALATGQEYVWQPPAAASASPA